MTDEELDRARAVEAEARHFEAGRDPDAAVMLRNGTLLPDPTTILAAKLARDAG